MTSLITAVVNLLTFSTPDRPGSSDAKPMGILAAPGLMTLLDVSLFRTVEGQLTATLTTSHALLAAWLTLQRQAVAVLEELQQDAASDTGGYKPPQQQTRALQMESLARACFEAACDAIALINTDRLAASANLSDPYDSTSAADNYFHHQYRGSVSSSSSSSQEELLSALQEAQLDTARRRYPLHQRRRECWESPRLYCPDHVWADDVSQTCQRLLRQLHKHPFATDLNNRHLAKVEASLSSSSFRGGTASQTTYSEYYPDSLVREQMDLLWLVLKKDLPTRLFQFRAAMEAESVVTKRLYLIKCEYRAPFRAFLEAHHSVQRAPSLGLVQEFSDLTASSNKSSKMELRRAQVKDRLQKLLETPQLVQALALEQRCEEFECSMAQQLVSFTELARYLDQKRARVKATSSGNATITQRAVRPLQERLNRLRGLLVRGNKVGAEASLSAGIRPLLLDLQGVPRDEEALWRHHRAGVGATAGQTTSNGTSGNSSDGNGEDSNNNHPIDMDIARKQVDELLDDLKSLGALCTTRNAFVIEQTQSISSSSNASSNKRSELDIPSSIVRGCTSLDPELFKCNWLDWCTCTNRQDELTQTQDFEGLAEKLRRAEMQMSLAVASHKSLEVVRQRLEALWSDRSKRFEVLKAMLEEVCLREMNLHVHVLSPDRDKILPLPETSALGVFGRALELAGEPLPIG